MTQQFRKEKDDWNTKITDLEEKLRWVQSAHTWWVRNLPKELHIKGRIMITETLNDGFYIVKGRSSVVANDSREITRMKSSRRLKNSSTFKIKYSPWSVTIGDFRDASMMTSMHTTSTLNN